MAPAQEAWRELEGGKIWAPSPAPALPDVAWPGLHIWQQKPEPQACHLHKTTALSPKHFRICLLPAQRRWVGQDYYNPNLQMEKCSSHLRSGSKILEAGASGEVKLGTEESRLEKGQAWMGRVVEGGCSSPLPKEAGKSLPRALPP